MLDNKCMPVTTVSSRFQITLPAETRKALGIRPGDKLEVAVVGNEIVLRIARPPIEKVLERVWSENSEAVERLGRQTGHDAAAYVRELRGKGNER